MLESDIDAKLDRIREGDSRLEAGVGGIDETKKFVGNVEVDCIGDLPDESGANGKGRGVGFLELIGGWGIIDLGDLKLGVGKAKAGREVRFPAALAGPTKDGGEEGRDLEVATGEGEAALAHVFSAAIERDGAVAVEVVEAVVENASGKLDPQPVGKVKAGGDIEADSRIDGNGRIGQGAGDAGKDGASESLRAFQIIDEAEAKIDAGVGAEAGRIFRDDEFLIGKFIVHGPVSSRAEVGEVSRLRDLAGAIAFGVVEVEASGEFGRELKVEAKTEGELLIKPPVEAVGRAGEGALVVVISGGGGVGSVGIVGEAIGGKGAEANFVGAVEHIGTGQAVVGAGEVGGIGKDVGGAPAERDGLGFGEGVKVVGGVSAGNFVEEIIFGLSGNGRSLGGRVEEKEAVDIDGKADGEFIGNLLIGAEKDIGEKEVLGEAEVESTSLIIGERRFLLAEVVKKRGANAHFRKKFIVAGHGLKGGGPGAFDGGDGLPGGDDVLGVFGVVSVGKPAVGLIHVQTGKGKVGDFPNKLKGSKILRNSGGLNGRFFGRFFGQGHFSLSLPILLGLGIDDGLLGDGTGEGLGE